MGNNKKIKILNWNANGLINKMNEPETMLFNEHIDICFLTETKLTVESRFYGFKNYNYYRKDRIARNAGNRVMILVNKKFNLTEKMIDNRLLNNLTNIEAVAIELNDLVYAPPQNVIATDEINKLLSLSNKIVMGGDINAKHPAWGNRFSNKSGKVLQNFLIDNIKNYYKCIIQYSDEPTHYPYNGINGTVLDTFITKNVNIIKPQVINDLSSDHLPVMTYVDTNINNYMNKTIKLYYSKTDWQTYRQEINKKWTLVNSFETKNKVDDTINKLTDTLQTALITATPKWKNICILTSQKYGK